MGQLVIRVPDVTYVNEGQPDINYGTSDQLRVGNPVKEEVLRGLMRCNLLDEGVPAGAIFLPTSKLEINILTLVGDDNHLYSWVRTQPPPATWNEEDPDGVTWNTQPTNWSAHSYEGPTGLGWWTLTGGFVRSELQYALDYRSGVLSWFIWPNWTDVYWYAASDDYIIDESLRPKLTVDWRPKQRYWIC